MRARRLRPQGGSRHGTRPGCRASPQRPAYLNPQLGARLAAKSPAAAGPPDNLSARELEVLGLIALGHTNGEIASTSISAFAPIESHRAHIQQKTRLANRAELVASRATTVCSSSAWMSLARPSRRPKLGAHKRNAQRTVSKPRCAKDLRRPRTW